MDHWRWGKFWKFSIWEIAGSLAQGQILEILNPGNRLLAKVSFLHDLDLVIGAGANFGISQSGILLAH